MLTHLIKKGMNMAFISLMRVFNDILNPRIQTQLEFMEANIYICMFLYTFT